MSIVLITFFISLAGIALMIGRKLMVSPERHSSSLNNFVIDVPDLEEVKKRANKNFKRFSYIVLVVTLRVYLLSLDLAKKKYKALKHKISQVKRSRLNHPLSEAPSVKEANKFLKMISDYKTKISKIKKRIKEEEGLN